MKAMKGTTAKWICIRLVTAGIATLAVGSACWLLSKLIYGVYRSPALFPQQSLSEAVGAAFVPMAFTLFAVLRKTISSRSIVKCAAIGSGLLAVGLGIMSVILRPQHLDGTFSFLIAAFCWIFVETALIGLLSKFVINQFDAEESK